MQIFWVQLDSSGLRFRDYESSFLAPQKSRIPCLPKLPVLTKDGNGGLVASKV